jgi:N-acetylneuraminic acid mutarotase
MNKIVFSLSEVFGFGFLLMLSTLMSSFGTSTIKSPIVEHGWTLGSPMPTPRTEIAAAILDGKIYVVGGQTKTELTDVVEVYTPSSGKWSTNVAPLPFPMDHTALDAYNGKLYLVGGFIEPDEGPHRRAINSLFIYDPLKNEWEEGEPMPTARAGLTAKFIDGILYAIGGSTGDNEGQVGLNEAYDPKTNSWTKKAPMPTARHHITSQLVEGKLYVIGGRETDVPSSIDTNEMYDPKQDKWVRHEPMLTKRSSIASAYLDGGIYVFGGEKEEGSFDTNERYDIKMDKWTRDIPMPTPRLGLESVEYDGKIYVIGGKESQSRRSATDVNEIFTSAIPLTDRFIIKSYFS